MALFNNRPEGSDASAPSSTSRQRNAPSSAPVGQINMVGQGAVIEGTLQVKGDVRIGGKVIGEVEVEGKMITTPEGIVEGDVVASNADIAGTVKGTLTISERLILKSTSKVYGDIRTPKLIIEDGAIFTGKCDMSGKKPKAAQKGVTATSKPAAAGKMTPAGNKPNSQPATQPMA